MRPASELRAELTIPARETPHCLVPHDVEVYLPWPNLEPRFRRPLNCFSLGMEIRPTRAFKDVYTPLLQLCLF